MLIRHVAIVFLSLLLVPGMADAKRLRFAGYDFKIKEGRGLGPGPNDWARSQAFVDKRGRLHLKFSEKNGRWYAGEIQSISKLGFGTYEMEFEGDIGGQDKNVVFGFFNYPSSDVGPDATNEIDIEFARWGNNSYQPLNYTVWPAVAGLSNAHKTFEFRRGVRRSLHRFTWSREQVVYSSVELKANGSPGSESYWAFKPADFQDRIASSPMSIYFNLWGFRGQKPSDGKPVEVIVNSFKFTPAP
ncbi:glycoside hydrolase family 16 protein [Rhizobium sp. KVB221]|uniref:Glycoside hydrolase family 16 protein n=1 Tax=Rhizobium setariae TaxID=2801340 RepID=A0A937CN88_9HYPH|nr:glycoside hydrolase family 16 protein [Rhizobium setariae]MBL0371754.1 glycoside hydrolase family 16 protein [Rhizobium setariae]